MPLGRSVSSKNSARRSAPIGVALAGFTTIGAPTASAGATLCATRFSGKLNGVMPSTGPIGNRRSSPIREPNAASVSRRISSSSPWRIVSEAHRNVDTARAASTRAHFSGFPPSAAISWAFSSMVSASRREMWSSAVERAATDSCFVSSNTAAALAVASSTSSAVGMPISATSESSKGFFTSKVPSPVRHCPFTRYGRTVMVGSSLPLSSRSRRGAPRRGTPRRRCVVRRLSPATPSRA